MIVNLPTPPRPTGDNDRDIKAMNEWCITLHRKLVGILRNLDGFNITAVPSDRLTGTIPEELLPQAELTTAELEGVDPYANVLSGISLLSEEGETE